MNDDQSTVIRLRPDVRRDRADNARTRLAGPRDAQPPVEPIENDDKLSFSCFFLSHYEELRREANSRDRAGVLVAAFRDGACQGTAFVPARTDRPGLVSVGRHGCADLFVLGDDGLSLRQLAVLVFPVADDGEIRFRVVDLRTPSGMEVEQGRRLHALEAEGPVFLRCSRTSLMVLTVDPTLPWPEDPQEGWASVPERVYLDEREVTDPPALAPERGRPPQEPDADQPHGSPRSEVTRVVPMARVRNACLNMVVEGSEEALGVLVVRNAEGREARMVLGPRAVRRGVLLGRYDRCDTGGLSVLGASGISRVHALLMELRGKLYAFDVGSTNGMTLDDREVRVLRLRGGTTWNLAEDSATLTWRLA